MAGVACNRTVVVIFVCVVVALPSLWMFNGVGSSGGSGWTLSGWERTEDLGWSRDASKLNEERSSISRPFARASKSDLTRKNEKGQEATVILSKLQTTFQFYEDLPMDYSCGEPGDMANQCSGCQALNVLTKYVKSREVKDVRDLDLHIVPMDHLARLSPSSPSYFARVQDVLDALTRDQRYLHYGGSNHIFLCLTVGCRRLMEEIIERHYVGKDTRAMWVGVEADVEGVGEEWPCPDRVLIAPPSLVEIVRESTSGRMCSKATLAALSLGLFKTLELAAPRGDGMNRWKCSRKAWNVNRLPFKDTLGHGCIPVKRHNLCFSKIPKCATTTMIFLYRRMNGIEPWYHISGGTHQTANGLKYISGSEDFLQYNETFTDTQTVKVAILRDPVERFISAYMDWIAERRVLSIVGLPRSVPTPSLDDVASYFLKAHYKGQMGKVNVHFRPMGYFVGYENTRYDYFITVPHLGEEMEKLLKSMGLWDEYGASGWGTNRTESFMEAKGRNKAKNSTVVPEVTPEVLGKLHIIYAADYRQFGFPMQPYEEYMAQQS